MVPLCMDTHKKSSFALPRFQFPNCRILLFIPKGCCDWRPWKACFMLYNSGFSCGSVISTITCHLRCRWCIGLFHFVFITTLHLSYFTNYMETRKVENPFWGSSLPSGSSNSSHPAGGRRLLALCFWRCSADGEDSKPCVRMLLWESESSLGCVSFPP